jgi:beta-glucosidase
MRNDIITQAVMFLLVTGVMFSCNPAVTEKGRTEQKIDSLVNMMTLSEKIGQLIQENGGDGHDADIKCGRVGSVLNETDPGKVNYLQKLAVDSSRLGIPLIFARDVIHGFRTIFPIPLGMAASFNTDLVEKSADIAASEAASAGIRWTFSPMIDISRDPRWGRVAETFGEDTWLQSNMGRAMVRGYQGDSLDEKGSIAACVKHFVAYGAAEGGRDYNTVSLPENVIRDVYFPPFKACVDEGVSTLMPSFNEINGIPASGNSFLLRQVLTDEWKFKGVVVSDWESIIQLMRHGYTPDTMETAFQAFNAGLHVEMNSKAYANCLPELIREKRISMKQLDEAVKRVLRLKYELGLFENPYTRTEEFPPFLNENYKEIARQLASQSIVLLKNENRLLPINVKAGKIAVIGPLADSPHDQMGTWCMDGKKSDAITPLTSLTEYFGTDRIIYAPGLEISRTRSREGFPEALSAANQAEIVILFIGEESILSGESHCRADIGLPGAQEELIREIAKTGKPVVAVVLAGRPLTFEDVIGELDALLYAWHPGTMAGPAITDVLTGKVVPSGKLPITFPRHVGQVPVYYNHKNTGKPATDESWQRLDDIPAEAPQLSIGNTNHYLDYGFKPWFPFGYGLSYTTFGFSDIRISDPVVALGDSLIISAKLRNSGEYEATEVVQLYIRDMVGSRTRPVKELKGFKRISLKPNEVKEVVFHLHTNQLGFHNQKMQYVTEPGDFRAWIGSDSEASLEISFKIE